MKVLHLCLGCFFPDGYTYQENLLPKFHKNLGYDVEVVASLQCFDKNGNPSYMESAGTYSNEYGIKVTRLNYKNNSKLCKKLKKYKGVNEAISNANPDVIFVHGCQFSDMKYLVKYAKLNPKVTIYVDNHADFSNSATNPLSKALLHKFLWRKSAKSIEPYTKMFYGVLPARVDFLEKIYKLPKEKCKLLVMGADDELVEKAAKPEVKQEVRKKYGIAEDDFLVMFGGKIDLFKQQVLLLMDAVNKINNPKLKLIVFGSIVPEMKDEIERRISQKVKYIGWVKSEESYPLFAACDLVVFPGRHSVFWEQVTGQGIPMLVKFWEGTTHIDLGGNVRFLYNDSMDEIKQNIEKLLDNPQEYKEMKKIAVEKGMKTFSYKDIAERSIK